MAEKLTPKQERFVQECLKGERQVDAYRIAYDCENMAEKTIWEESCRVAANRKVAAKLFEMQERVAKRTLVTVEKLTARLAEIDAAAYDDGQFSASNTAIMGQAKLNGLLVDKADIKHTGNMTFVTNYEDKKK